MAAAAAAASAWLPGLAASRPATSTGAASSDAGGRRRHTLRLQCEPSSLAVATSLLAAFAAQARGQPPSQGLPRGVEVTLEPPTAAASSSVRRGQGQAATDGGAAAGDASSAGPALLVVHFTASDPAAEGACEQAAQLFEAYWQYHVKAAKSDLHCRMRTRLAGLRQQLLLHTFEAAE